MAATIAQTPISGQLLITPDPYVPNYQLLIQRNRTTGLWGVFYSIDSGTTFRPLLPTPISANSPGSVLTVLNDMSVGWKLPPPGSAIQSANLSFIHGVFVGSLVTTQPFGFFQIPFGNAMTAVELQVSIQTIADNFVQVDLVNDSGTPQGKVVTIAPGSKKGVLKLNPQLLIPTEKWWGFTILACGNNGEQLTARLVLSE